MRLDFDEHVLGWFNFVSEILQANTFEAMPTYRAGVPLFTDGIECEIDHDLLLNLPGHAWV